MSQSPAGLFHKMMVRVRALASHFYYPFVVALLAGLDLFIVIVPTDGLLVTGVFAKPKRWFFIGSVVTLGSCLGALILAALIHWDANWIYEHFPSFFNSSGWTKTEQWMQEYGTYSIVLGTLSPLPLQPFVIIPALAKMPLETHFLYFFIGRWIKFTVICYVASHAPRLLSRFKEVQHDLKSLEEDKEKEKNAT